MIVARARCATVKVVPRPLRRSGAQRFVTADYVGLPPYPRYLKRSTLWLYPRVGEAYFGSMVTITRL